MSLKDCKKLKIALQIIIRINNSIEINQGFDSMS